MYVDSVQRTDRVTAERVIDEAARWGVPRERATATVADLLERAPEALANAREETEGVSPELVAMIESQLANLRPVSRAA